jgi:exopolysaccharide biosynthesis polyprenyl glycosylphosphotransferase
MFTTPADFSGPSPLVGYLAGAILLVAGWTAALWFFANGRRANDSASWEIRRVVQTSLLFFGAIAAAAFVLRLELARWYLLAVLSTGLAAVLFARWMWRRWLRVERESGRQVSRAVILGSTASARTIAASLDRHPDSGYRVAAVCIAGDDESIDWADRESPATYDVDEVREIMYRTGADTLIVAGSNDLSPEQVRRLSWSIVPGREQFVLAPGLHDVSPERISARSVAGLAMIDVETARNDGSRVWVKRLCDILLATTLVVLLAPLLLALALLVRSTSPGPTIFRQERVGLGGRPFVMLKFRTMVADAEAHLETLHSQARSEGNAVLFKMADDPRVTRVGRVMRRYSLDELPQLINVIVGQMSLVGPRPPLAREVELYEPEVHRRFLVKPGVTGLWQVNGRSTLSWDESVRYDLYYVDNWSLAGDLGVLWKTARAVLAKNGAF